MKKIPILFVLVLCLITQSAGAISVFDLRADVLMLRLPELKANLNLNANQQILWAQCESKTKVLLRGRELRQIKTDAAVRDMIQQPNAELRDLDAQLNEERRLTGLDDQQAREFWLTMFDALDDKQRGQVQNFLLEQLMEAADAEKKSDEKPASAPRKGRGMSHGQNGGNTPGSF